MTTDDKYTVLLCVALSFIVAMNVDEHGIWGGLGLTLLLVAIMWALRKITDRWIG